MQFGVKFATGSFDNNFIAGPQTGERLDRGLQPGTGTADLLVGAFNFGALSATGIILRGSCSSRSTRGTKPGRGPIQPECRLPLRRHRARHTLAADQRANRGRESGPNADVDNSGATLVYLSPGVNFQVVDNLHAYAYAQVPIYQRVNGWQIEPRYTVTVGVYYTM